MEDPATPELLDRWIKGDGDAAEQIYSRYVERVQRYSMKWTKDTILAEEVAAEAMAQALAGTREGKKPDRFTRWLLGISKNLAIMRYRLSRREIGYNTEALS
ncbi:MAG: sigma factor, partial [Planctomycetota bacterium]